MSRSTGLPNLQVLNFSPTMFAVSHFCASGMLMKQSLEFEHTPAWWHGIQIYYWKRKWTTMKLLCHIFRKLENKFRYYMAGLIIIINKYTLDGLYMSFSLHCFSLHCFLLHCFSLHIIPSHITLVSVVFCSRRISFSLYTVLVAYCFRRTSIVLVAKILLLYSILILEIHEAAALHKAWPVPQSIDNKKKRKASIALTLKGYPNLVIFIMQKNANAHNIMIMIVVTNEESSKSTV